MLEFNKSQLAEYLGTTIGTVETNFPKLKARSLKKGILITKRGIGEKAIYEVEKTTPQNIPSNNFSSQKNEKWTEDLPGEVWVDCYCDKSYEVSSCGRFRNKKTLKLNKGSVDATRGYQSVSLSNKTYMAHRVVLASFDPIEGFENYTVDHIDGNRQNNYLDNLQWVSNEENVGLMLMRRGELNKELTRLLKTHSYEEVLQLLRGLD